MECERCELVSKENDVAYMVRLVAKLFALCSLGKTDEAKLFRKRPNMAGDYIGCGYAFVDAFMKIYDEYEETVGEDLYRQIRLASENIKRYRKGESE